MSKSLIWVENGESYELKFTECARLNGSKYAGLWNTLTNEVMLCSNAWAEAPWQYLKHGGTWGRVRWSFFMERITKVDPDLFTKYAQPAIDGKGQE